MLRGDVAEEEDFVPSVSGLNLQDHTSEVEATKQLMAAEEAMQLRLKAAKDRAAAPAGEAAGAAAGEAAGGAAGEAAGGAAGEAAGGAWLRRATLAAAVAEERLWQDYEFAEPDPNRYVDLTPYASFSPVALASWHCHGVGTSMALASCVREAVGDVGAAPVGADAAEEASAASEAVRAALAQATEAETEAEAEAEAEAETEAGLAALETQVWLELDALLSSLADRTDAAYAAPRTDAAYAQLLSLLPPPPAAGWPAEFRLGAEAVALRESTEDKLAVAMFNPGVDTIEPYVPCAVTYPPRRRAQRLSFMVWPTIALENARLQASLPPYPNPPHPHRTHTHTHGHTYTHTSQISRPYLFFLAGGARGNEHGRAAAKCSAAAARVAGASPYRRLERHPVAPPTRVKCKCKTSHILRLYTMEKCGPVVFSLSRSLSALSLFTLSSLSRLSR